MYIIGTRQITHVLALSIAFSIVFAICCSNVFNEKLFNIIYDIETIFVPLNNPYSNYISPYYD